MDTNSDIFMVAKSIKISADTCQTTPAVQSTSPPSVYMFSVFQTVIAMPKYD